ncbi:efflux RND transporter permease subunit, partial [Pseudomonas yangonensis]|uniref:efflux RND transporter permease subunit n=1 Tax=Pseudomonas yangonensis TaxID=2579922 RepID=UPI0013793D73
ILFMGGIVERLFREFSLTLAVAVVISLLVSLSLTPMPWARWVEAEEEQSRSRLQEWGDRVQVRVRAFYARSLAWALRRSVLML